MAVKALTALLCVGIAVPLIVLLRCKIDRKSMSGLGLVRDGAMRSFGLGLLVTGGWAAAFLALGTAAGWLSWSSIDWPTLATFLVSNSVITFALEALPEELTFRGYAYRTLSTRLRRWTAALCSLALLLIMPMGANLARAAITALAGGDPDPVTFAPPGEEPVSYAILLIFFGSARPGRCGPVSHCTSRSLPSTGSRFREKRAEPNGQPS